jgi:hypothetical protein
MGLTQSIHDMSKSLTTVYAELSKHGAIKTNKKHDSIISQINHNIKIYQNAKTYGKQHDLINDVVKDLNELLDDMQATGAFDIQHARICGKCTNKFHIHEYSNRTRYIDLANAVHDCEGYGVYPVIKLNQRWHSIMKEQKSLDNNLAHESLEQRILANTSTLIHRLTTLLELCVSYGVLDKNVNHKVETLNKHLGDYKRAFKDDERHNAMDKAVIETHNIIQNMLHTQTFTTMSKNLCRNCEQIEKCNYFKHASVSDVMGAIVPSNVPAAPKEKQAFPKQHDEAKPQPEPKPHGVPTHAPPIHVATLPIDHDKIPSPLITESHVPAHITSTNKKPTWKGWGHDDDKVPIHITPANITPAHITSTNKKPAWGGWGHKTSDEPKKHGLGGWGHKTSTDIITAIKTTAETKKHHEKKYNEAIKEKNNENKHAAVEAIQAADAKQEKNKAGLENTVKLHDKIIAGNDAHIHTYNKLSGIMPSLANDYQTKINNLKSQNDKLRRENTKLIAQEKTLEHFDLDFGTSSKSSNLWIVVIVIIVLIYIYCRQSKKTVSLPGL